MGGRGSNSMDRLKAGSHTAAAARISEASTVQKAKSAAEGALTRAQKRQELAHASVNLFTGDKSSKTYTDLIAERDKADAAYIRANEKMIEATSNLNKVTERAETIASRQKMPWETDAKYSGNKNAKLLWLRDHPESKYNNSDFIMGIKRIEAMSDRGVSAERRRKAFKDLVKRHDMTQREGRNFIAPEFLK